MSLGEIHWQGLAAGLGWVVWALGTMSLYEERGAGCVWFSLLVRCSEQFWYQFFFNKQTFYIDNESSNFMFYWCHILMPQKPRRWKGEMLFLVPRLTDWLFISPSLSIFPFLLLFDRHAVAVESGCLSRSSPCSSPTKLHSVMECRYWHKTLEEKLCRKHPFFFVWSLWSFKFDMWVLF